MDGLAKKKWFTLLRTEKWSKVVSGKQDEYIPSPSAWNIAHQYTILLTKSLLDLKLNVLVKIKVRRLFKKKQFV